MTKRPTWDNPTANTANTVRQTYRLTSLSALRTAMVGNGFFSGYALAKASGVNVSTVNHLVHNRRSTASGETVGKLREALGKDAEDLFVLDESQIHRHQEQAA